MRNFASLTAEVDSKLFYRSPEFFTKESDKDLLASALGATIYIPAIRKNLLKDILKMKNKDATSVVVCLEDSVPDSKLSEAEENFHRLLEEIAQSPNLELPLVFVRPRTPEHFSQIVESNFGLLAPLAGFVFPKFDNINSVATEFCHILAETNERTGLNLYFMPVIESPSVVHVETRFAALSGISQVLTQFRGSLLAVRVGATDMSSSYGMRRSQDFTIYDNRLISGALADIVNVLGHADDCTVITGAVWEHFNTTDRTFKPLLRETLFNDDPKLRTKLLTQGYDTFLKELQLDKVNGFTGKTVIHPSHISFVHSNLVVTHEEFSDAEDILKDMGGGANASTYRNKMNEVKPHTAWAKRIMNRASMFGVSNPDITFVDFLEQYNIR